MITICTKPMYDQQHAASFMTRTFESFEDAEGWMYDQEEVRFFQMYGENEYEITDISSWACNYRLAEPDAPFPGFDPWDELGVPEPINKERKMNEPGTTEYDNFLGHIDHEAVIVGRHTPDGLPDNIRLHRQFDITWSTDPEECARQWRELRAEVEALPQYEPKFKILLQNVPAILAAVLLKECWRDANYGSFAPLGGIGIIISKPGERQAGVEKLYRFAEMAENSYTSAVSDARAMERIVNEVNPRAKTRVEGDDLNAKLFVTMDPIAPFVFDHIEWL